MPGGKIHDKGTVYFLPVGLIVGFAWGGVSGLLLVGASFLFAGFMFNGDLDHDVGATPYNRWGPLRCLWYPYMKVMPHRSIWSHGPILGTAFRLIYLLILALAALAIPTAMDWVDLKVIAVFIVERWEPTLMIVAGLELGAFQHTLLDWTIRN